MSPVFSRINPKAARLGTGPGEKDVWILRVKKKKLLQKKFRRYLNVTGFAKMVAKFWLVVYLIATLDTSE